MERFRIDGSWTLHFTHPFTGAEHRIPATVPGNVELDLARAGLLSGDPIPPDRENAEHWIDLTDWEYETVFRFDGLPSSAVRADLVLEGVDTVGEVFLNGEEILQCCNMFLAHRVEVTGRLRIGDNHLRIRIAAPEIAAREFPPPPPFHWTGVTREASVYLRKARHMWGWDNAPRRLSAGLWREAALEFLPECRFESVYAYTERLIPERNEAELCCSYAFTVPERDLSSYRLRLTLERDGKRAFEATFPARHTTGILKSLRVTDPALWFPAGYGEAPLYDFVLMLEKAGETVARHTHSFGIREIRLERTETTDAEGHGEFQFYCNGEKIYVRGANWKPLSPYPSQTPEKLERALNLLCECNCNLVRVWGGGVYEDTGFFDFCDRHGIMVWQDFMFACEFPPREEFFLKEVAKEAESVIRKFRNHPSLVLWCGDNETDAAFFWGPGIERHIRPSHNRLSRGVLPEAVLNFDPARDFLPSSPYIADSMTGRDGWCFPQQDDILAFAPEQHVYTAGPDLPPGGFREFFRRSAAHFSSETGPIGVCAMSESPEIVERELPRLRRFWNVAPEDVPLEGEMIHQSDHYCAVWCRTARKVTEKMFGRSFSPDHPEELIAALNFYVADLFKFVVESWRVQKFRRTGVVWWSLLDMWPMAFNYSVVDSLFRKKLPFDFLRLAQQPLALMGRDPAEDGVPHLYAVNDTLRSAEGRFRVATAAGETLREDAFRVAANGVAELGELPLKRGEVCFLAWESETGTGRNFYLAPGEPYDFDFCRSWAETVRRF